MAKPFNLSPGMANAFPILQDPGAVFQRGPGGILPERGSARQRDMVAMMMQNAMQSAPQSGSPLLAFLTPMLGGAVGARTDSLYQDAQQARDQEAIQKLVGLMGGGTGSVPLMEPGGYSTRGAPAAPPQNLAPPASGVRAAGDIGFSGVAPVQGASGRGDLTFGDMSRPLPASVIPPEVRAGIFAGESGGDYNALFGYSNRNGPFSNVRLTDMTVDEAIAFSDPSGPYGQWVKGQIGRVATPMGAYQVVGTTLRDAKRGMGLTGNERMDQATQDAIGSYIYSTQGTGAWEGYRGPRDPSSIPVQGSSVGGAPYNSGYGRPGISSDLISLMVDPNISEPIRGLASSVVQSRLSGGGYDPMDAIELQRAMIGLEADRVRLDQLMQPQDKPRNIIKGADGFQYYEDTGERVLPNISAPDTANDAETTRQANVALQAIEERVQASQATDPGKSREAVMWEIAQDPAGRRLLEIAGIDPDTLPAPAAPVPEVSDGGGWLSGIFGGNSGPAQPVAPTYDDPLGIR